MHYAIVAELGRTPSAFCITPNAMGALRAIWLTNFYYLCGGYYLLDVVNGVDTALWVLPPMASLTVPIDW